MHAKFRVGWSGLDVWAVSEGQCICSIIEQPRLKLLLQLQLFPLELKAAKNKSFLEKPGGIDDGSIDCGGWASFILEKL